MIASFVIAAFSCGTANVQPRASNTAKPHDSLLVDSDGNRYPIKLLLDGKHWMITNLNLNIPGSYCYDNATENCERYGRLYSWKTAKQGCMLLGEGWRLPTNEEGRELTMLYGGVEDDSVLARNGRQCFRKW